MTVPRQRSTSPDAKAKRPTEARKWLRANGYGDIADRIDKLIASWGKKGCRHRPDGVPFSAESPETGDHPGVKVAMSGFRVEAGGQRGS